MPLLSSLSRLASGLARTRDSLRERLGGLLRPGRPIDETALAEIEEALLSADLGASLTAKVLGGVRRRAAAASGEAATLPDMVREELTGLIRGSDRDAPPAPAAGAPHVVMVVGVNGGGKTSTVGKLAAAWRREGHTVVVAAADTFRAAAAEQLQIWAERSGATLVRHAAGADPSAVVFDAAALARSRQAARLLIDTAGRLHTRSNLMQELEKIVRVAGKGIPGAPHETLLVLDATTGQNGLQQGREFLKAAPVTGLVLTKLDGTARGGIALAIASELSVPIRWVGVGEGVEDLVPFDAAAYVDGLLGGAAA